MKAKQLDLFAEEDCAPFFPLATGFVWCPHGVQLMRSGLMDLEVCDLTPCPHCSMLPEQSSPAHLRSVLNGIAGGGLLLDTIEEYLSYGGTE